MSALAYRQYRRGERWVTRMKRHQSGMSCCGCISMVIVLLLLASAVCQCSTGLPFFGG